MVLVGMWSSKRQRGKCLRSGHDMFFCFVYYDDNKLCVIACV
jgi:hypothetical protein